MRNEDHPLIDCPRRGCARGRQDYEQRLQEQPSRMVRSDVHRTAPHTNWVEVTSRRFPPRGLSNTVGRENPMMSHYLIFVMRCVTDSTRTSREVQNGS
jgi:hypothetical protein